MVFSFIQIPHSAFSIQFDPCRASLLSEMTSSCIARFSPNRKRVVVLFIELSVEMLVEGVLAVRAEQSAETVELQWCNLLALAAIFCICGSKRCSSRDGQLREEATY
ncbi:hypothetical protein VNO78_30729 [Psophocarpus tetragonolobus]|uniref:Uncharacterized protein n=1 Tax=Psophocarpus tetragonolobus TaxID=3891 RepID=A0AAN9RXB5_PSOTE